MFWRQKHANLSIEDIFKRYSDEIFRYFYLRTYSKEVAEDLTQETFIKLCLGNSEFDPTKSSIRTWLYIISRSILLNYSKKEKRRATLDLSEFEEIIYENTNDKDDIEFLIKLINEMEEHDRDILVLRLVNNLSTKEICEVLQISESNVKVRLHRSFNKLKKIAND